MKKILLVAAAFLITGSFMSCTKDYTCECKFTDGTPTLTIPIEKAKKNDATDACDAFETTYKIGDPKVTCTLK